YAVVLPAGAAVPQPGPRPRAVQLRWPDLLGLQCRLGSGARSARAGARGRAQLRRALRDGALEHAAGRSRARPPRGMTPADEAPGSCAGRRDVARAIAV